MGLFSVIKEALSKHDCDKNLCEMYRVSIYLNVLQQVAVKSMPHVIDLSTERATRSVLLEVVAIA